MEIAFGGGFFGKRIRSDMAMRVGSHDRASSYERRKKLGMVMSLTPTHRRQRRVPGQPGLRSENLCQEPKTKMKQEKEKG